MQQVVKKILLIVTLILSAFVYYACSSSSNVTIKGVSQYSSIYKLTDEIAYSSVSDLEIRIPKGWFTAEDTICKCIDIWLIRDDFSATLNFTPMNIDTIVAENFKSNLSKLVELSKSSKRNSIKEFVQQKTDEYFEIGNKSFGAYEYIGDEGTPIRVALFYNENKVYELSAMPASEVGRGKVNPEELFIVQNSILASLAP